MTVILHGHIHGKTIELTQESGLPEGQAVEVTVRMVADGVSRKPGDGLLGTEGALKDDPYWDAIMEEVHLERKRDMRGHSAFLSSYGADDEHLYDDYSAR